MAQSSCVLFLGLLVAVSSGCTVEIAQQLSQSACKGNYGCFDGNNSMWVSNGCRAFFSCNGISNVKCDPCDPGPCPHSKSVRHTCDCVAAPATPKYMLLDDRNVVDSTTAKLVHGKMTKHPNGALIKEERDYEMRFDNMQPNVWYDPHMKKWRAWYSAFTSCAKPKTEVPFCNNASQQCGSVNDLSKNDGIDRGSGFLYAESDDGITWTKPNLNLTEWKGNKQNNLIELDGMTTGIYLDEMTTNSSERYKISTGSNGAGSIAVSSDGLTWSPPINLEKQTHARWDTPKNLVWDPVRKQWIIYVRSAPTVDEPEGGNLRVQSYTHSLTDDFLGDWAPATPTGLNSSVQYQPDGLVVWPYEGIYLGIGNIFNPSQEAGSQAVIGQVNGVLGWSTDGRRWKWLIPNKSLIPLGNAGDFDACGIFGAKQDPLRTTANGTMRLYYTGCNGPFFGSRGCALGMATLQRDGFAGYQGGLVYTAAVRVSGSTLKVSVDGGSTQGIQVGIVDSAKFTLNSSDPILGQQTDAVVSWNGKSDLSKFLNGAVLLVFKIPADATAFAFSI